ncbi:MAG: hypothetical protein ABIH82_01415 [Candidatus Woesearchaeota archaeon]
MGIEVILWQAWFKKGFSRQDFAPYTFVAKDLEVAQEYQRQHMIYEGLISFTEINELGRVSLDDYDLTSEEVKKIKKGKAVYNLETQTVFDL